MRIDLSDYKKKRPHILPLLEWIERVLQRMDDMQSVPADLPYAEGLARSGLGHFPFLFIAVDTPAFQKCMHECINYCDTHHRSIDPQSFSLVILGAWPQIRTNFAEVYGKHIDPEDFIASRLVEMTHVANQGVTVTYHDSLAKLLSLTRIDKATDVPVTMLKQPYPELYLDWRNAPVTDKLGNVYEGAFVKRTESTYADLKRVGIIDSDAALKRAVDNGSINETDPVIMTAMLFVHQRASHSDNFQQSLFVMAYSETEGVSVEEAVRAHRDAALDTELPDDALTFDVLRAPIGMVINSVLYMNSDEDYRQELKGWYDGVKKLAKIKNKAKRRKMEKRLYHEAYNCVRIGKQYTLPDFDRAEGSSHGKKGTHIRFGHFHKFLTGPKYQRDAHGEIEKDAEGNRILIPAEDRDWVVHWLQPTIVNKDEGEAVPTPRKLQ